MTTLYVRALAEGGEEYTYIFERTHGLVDGPANGTISVLKKDTPEDPGRNVATGICEFSRGAAR